MYNTCVELPDMHVIVKPQHNFLSIDRFGDIMACCTRPVDWNEFDGVWEPEHTISSWRFDEYAGNTASVFFYGRIVEIIR